MSGGEPGFEGFDALGGAPSPPAGGPSHAAGPWFVRFAGRRSGPFDAERLRTLARRGALSRMHQLSSDGTHWVPANAVRAVFNEDGSVVASGTGGALDLEPEPAPLGGAFPEGAPAELPLSSVPRRAFGSAFVRPVVLCALALATVMLALPTSRDESMALAWWWSEGPASLAVRGLCVLAVLVAWVVAFLPPEPARAASMSAVAAVLAAAGGVAMAPWAPWAVVLGLLLPIAAILVALDAVGSTNARMIGLVCAIAAGILGAASIVLGVFWFSWWALAGMVLGAAGWGSLVVAGVRAHRRPGPNADGVFWCSVAGAVGGLGAVFAAAFDGLAGPVPMNGAQAAVSACLVLAFSALSWASVHEASESSHLLPSAEDGASPA